jgi:AcrR family transcriptional regulator
MRRLASALHVSLPTVYTAVASREVLIGELQYRLVSELIEALSLRVPDAVGVPAGKAGPLEHMAQGLQAWADSQPTLAEFLLVEPIPVGVAERLVTEAAPEHRRAAAAVVRDAVGQAPRHLDAVVALAYVVAQARATLALSTQQGLADVSPGQWLQIGCGNIAIGLRALAGLPAASRT